MAQVRVRFGIRAISIFPNAGIFVFHVDGAQLAKLRGAVDVLRAALIAVGKSDIAAKIIFELS
jgi:hypothetical protein